MAVSCGVGCRFGSDSALLWLWCRPAAIAPIRPLAREPPYADGGRVLFPWKGICMCMKQESDFPFSKQLADCLGTLY